MTDIPADIFITSWTERLHVTPTHSPRPVLANVLIALREAPEWEGVLAFDEFSLTVVAKLPPPWRVGDNDWKPRPWTDADDVQATDWLHQQKIYVPVSIAVSAVATVARDASFHPVRDYLGGLKWDCTAR